MRRAGCLFLLLLALACRPAAAGPRITLDLDGSTLDQAFRRLQEKTGLQFRSQDGAGEAGFKDGPGAKRIRFAWKDATLGRVVRDLCGSFGLTASAMGDGGYWFRPGSPPKRPEVSVDGVAFSVGSISQSEMLSLVPGQEQPQVQRALSMRLVCRAEDGDGDILGPMTRLSLVDDRGNRCEPSLPNFGSEYAYGMPDERGRTLTVQPWTGEHARRLRLIEGELSVYARAAEQRFVLPLPAKELPPDQQSGPVRLSLKKLRTANRRTESEFRLTWSSDVDVPLSGPACVRVLIRLESGRTERVYSGYSTGLEEGESKFADFSFGAEFDANPTAVEVVVPVRSGPQRKLAFRLENIVTPFGQPEKFRKEPLNLKPRPTPSGTGTGAGRNVPDAFYDPAGGSLPLTGLPKPSQDGALQVHVSLSRRKPDGTWSAARWVQLDVGEEPPVLKQLAPGTYRVRLTLWRRPPGGPLTRLPGRAFEVEIRQGTGKPNVRTN